MLIRAEKQEKLLAIIRGLGEAQVITTRELDWVRGRVLH